MLPFDSVQLFNFSPFSLSTYKSCYQLVYLLLLVDCLPALVLVPCLFCVLQQTIVAHAPIYLPLKYTIPLFYMNRGTVVVFNVIWINYPMISNSQLEENIRVSVNII